MWPQDHYCPKYGTQHPHEINYNNCDSSNLVMMPPNNTNRTLIQHYDPAKVSVASTRSVFSRDYI